MSNDALKKFLNRIKTAAQAKTDVRIPLAEANELAADIAALLTEVVDKNRNVPQETVVISLDGGGMKK